MRKVYGIIAAYTSCGFRTILPRWQLFARRCIGLRVTSTTDPHLCHTTTLDGLFGPCPQPFQKTLLPWEERVANHIGPPSPNVPTTTPHDGSASAVRWLVHVKAWPRKPWGASARPLTDTDADAGPSKAW